VSYLSEKFFLKQSEPVKKRVFSNDLLFFAFNLPGFFFIEFLTKISRKHLPKENQNFKIGQKKCKEPAKSYHVDLKI